MIDVRRQSRTTLSIAGILLLALAALAAAAAVRIHERDDSGSQPQPAASGPSLPSGTLSLAPHAETAAPKGPQANVFNAGEVVPLSHGQILITDLGNLNHTGSAVIIADRAGRLLWNYKGTLDIPHSAYPMPNGDILISDTGDNRVIEVNRKSHIVWNSDNLGGGHGRLGQGRLSDGSYLNYPNDAKPLSNGQILISCRLQNRVVQITRSGHITWEAHGFLHRQHNPDRLADGNTLIADSDDDRVLEVDKTGKHIIWEFSSGLSWPRDVDPMKNGDFLIADSNNNRLVEVTRSKHTVNQWTGIQHVYSAAPLPNGDILVGDGSTYGVVEITQQHKIVWVLNHSSAGGPPPPTSVVNGGFEQTVKGSKTIPYDWDRNDALAYSLAPGKRADMVRDSSEHHSGHYSGRISYHGDSNGLFFSQSVSLTAGKRYQFSGWIKTKDVKVCHPCAYGVGSTPGHSAEYELAFYASTGNPPSSPATPIHTGTSGWQHDTAIFTVPNGVWGMGINPTLRGQGTVWFDDITLKQLK